MADDNWTPATGLLNACISLIWRCALAGAIWVGALWLFFTAMNGFVRIPALILIGFSAIAGSIVGLIIGRNLAERAGFVSLILTALALLAAGLVMVGGETVFNHYAQVAESFLRYQMVGIAMIVAGGWIVRFTLVDS